MIRKVYFESILVFLLGVPALPLPPSGKIDNKYSEYKVSGNLQDIFTNN